VHGQVMNTQTGQALHSDDGKPAGAEGDRKVSAKYYVEFAEKGLCMAQRLAI
jgi:hypothetical protein